MSPEFSEYQPQELIPKDFSKITEIAALGGAVAKFSAREIDGKYVVGNTDAEHRERYLACCSLVSDLIAYCKRKRQLDASWTPSALHNRVTEGLKNSPQLELTTGEFDLVVSELSLFMQLDFSSQSLDCAAQARVAA